MTISPSACIGREHGGARADEMCDRHHGSVPLIVPLTAEMAVQHGHLLLRKSRAEPFDGLRRQGNLRHEHNRILAFAGARAQWPASTSPSCRCR